MFVKRFAIPLMFVLAAALLGAGLSSAARAAHQDAPPSGALKPPAGRPTI